jgi:hypothetical protein
MGFLDSEVSGGGGAKLLKFDGRAGNYGVKGIDETFNNQEFIADIYGAKGGYMKFGEKGQPPERHLGPVFPKDSAPLRASLGDTDRNQWPKAKFGGDEPEDPWTQVIEIPMRHKETGELYVFTAQSKTALAAAKDLLGQCKRLPEGFEPVIRLGVGSYKSKFGVVKKPILSVVAKVAMEAEGEAENIFSDEIGF